MKRIYCLIVLVVLSFSCLSFAHDGINIPILCYHNFNPTTPGSMNLKPQKFESQLKWLKDNGFTIIPLKDAVAYLQGKQIRLPAKPVVISVDDGWQSAYKYLYPIIEKYRIPVTLFIYPQTISQGKNALTWEELKELHQTGLFDIQSHTDGHPNFKQERKRRTAESYEKFVQAELVHSKKVLEDKLGIKVTLLAWPFGIYDPYLEKAASNAGYEMAFTIDARTANQSYRPMAQPRYMIVDGQAMKTFIAIVNHATKPSNVVSAKKN